MLNKIKAVKLDKDKVEMIRSFIFVAAIANMIVMLATDGESGSFIFFIVMALIAPFEMLRITIDLTKREENV